MVERMDQVSRESAWQDATEVQSERKRAGVCKAKGSDENFIAETDEMDADRASIESCSTGGSRRGSRTCWHLVGNVADTRLPSWRQDVSRTAGCVQGAVRMHLGGRRIDEGNGRGGES